MPLFTLQSHVAANSWEGQHGADRERRSNIEGGASCEHAINQNNRIVTSTREDPERGQPASEISTSAGTLGSSSSPLHSRRRGGGNVARFITHRCKPNCYTQVIGDQSDIAARNIRKGEELTYDYSTDGVGTITCRCTPGCETLL